jgi:hypothetical protein
VGGGWALVQRKGFILAECSKKEGAEEGAQELQQQQ